jgi:hypothetical protein
MFRKIGYPAVVLSMLLFTAGGAMAQLAGTISNTEHKEESIGSTGKVDWTTGVITAVGIGPVQASATSPSHNRAMALQVARLDAYRKLLEAVKGVQVDSNTTVENFMITSDVINAKVSGFIQGATVMNTAYQSDGSVEVTIGMKLTGALADALLPKGPATMPAAVPPSAGAAVTPGQIYTGLIVDARGLNIKPAMAPKILNEDGKEVYGSAYINRDWAVREGMVGYLKDPVAAQANPRVTDKPLMVKALKVSGDGRVDMVISNADAASLQSASENLNMLQKCRVIVLVD